MLPEFNSTILGEYTPRIRKYCNGAEVSGLGAFPEGSELRIEVTASVKIGEAGVVLRLFPDGKEYKDIPMSFEDRRDGCVIYSVTLTPEKGLYYWELLFLRGYDTIFSDTENNVDLTLSRESGSHFRLLVYDRDAAAPDWFKGGIMYQIFPDRFARGERVFRRDGAVMHDSFDGEVEQYAEMPGGEVENNEFFGGSLYGVADKLDYLASLGVTVIYLNPIFKAYSNHRYDTGDYEIVDEMLGGDGALEELIERAAEKGIRLVLDGVFNHTGSDSRYFDKKRSYGGGAYSDKDSPYRDWYHFRSYPDDYECWWGVKILPRLDHRNESCRRYFTGEGGIAEKYMRMGIGGWRLDVADELSDDFLDEFAARVKSVSGGEGIVIGEVWENAADKIAYGSRRRYLTGGQLDSVMNYPLRNAIIDFMLWGDARLLYNTLTEIYASYPPHVSHSLMNLLGTHDTERILTVLGSGGDGDGLTNAEKAVRRLTDEQYARGVKLLKLAAVIQYTSYGVPSIYYGDEAGLEGYGDPFCRRPYPWGKENKELVEFYRTMGGVRKSVKCLKTGDFYAELCKDRAIKLVHRGEGETLVSIVSRAECEIGVGLDGEYTDLLTGKIYTDSVAVAPDSAVILLKN